MLVVHLVKMLNDDVKLRCSERLIDQCIPGKESKTKQEHRASKTHFGASFLIGVIFHVAPHVYSLDFILFISVFFFLFFLPGLILSNFRKPNDARRGNVLV